MTTTIAVAGAVTGTDSRACSSASGVGSGSKNAQAAKALVKFLTTPSSGAVFKAKGQEPG